MGANLYINSLYKRKQKQYYPQFKRAVHERDRGEGSQEKVEKYYDLMYSEGYFRDSYNSSSLADQLGFCWWQIVPKSGVFSGKQLIDFYLYIASLTVPKCRDRSYFIQKQGKLLAFLEKAIELGEEVVCSV